MGDFASIFWNLSTQAAIAVMLVDPLTRGLAHSSGHPEACVSFHRLAQTLPRITGVSWQFLRDV